MTLARFWHLTGGLYAVGQISTYPGRISPLRGKVFEVGVVEFDATVWPESWDVRLWHFVDDCNLIFIGQVSHHGYVILWYQLRCLIRSQNLNRVLFCVYLLFVLNLRTLVTADEIWVGNPGIRRKFYWCCAWYDDSVEQSGNSRKNPESFNGNQA